MAAPLNSTSQNSLQELDSTTGSSGTEGELLSNAATRTPRAADKEKKGYLGWLAGLASSPPRDKAKSASPPSTSPSPTGHAAAPSAAAAAPAAAPPAPDDKGIERRYSTDSGASSAAGSTGVPRRDTGDVAVTGDLPDISATPTTAALIQQSKQHADVSLSSAPPTALPTALRDSPSPPSPPSEPLAPVAEIACVECGMAIQGAVFMLHDTPYCCARHRLAAYHKMEKQGSGSAPRSRGASVPSMPQSGSGLDVSGSPMAPSPSTGLLARYATWC